MASGTKIRRGPDFATYWCPGCDEAHQITIGAGRWVLSGTDERPTIAPSVLIRSGHYAGHAKPDDCWCTYNREHPEEAFFRCSVCHSFVRDGHVEFLGDCTHALKGKTVPLPDWPKAG